MGRGIEDSCAQTRQGHRALDEYELMGHYEHWVRIGVDKGDPAPSRPVGVPWFKVEPRKADSMELDGPGCPYRSRNSEYSVIDSCTTAVLLAKKGIVTRISSLCSRYAANLPPLQHLLNGIHPSMTVINALMCACAASGPLFERRRRLYPPYAPLAKDSAHR